MNKEGNLRVWHIPQVPGEAFYVPVPTPQAGATILELLADYDRFQYENAIKPDYCNASGLEVFEDGEWVEWYSNDGEDIDEFAEYSLTPPCPECYAFRGEPCKAGCVNESARRNMATA